MTVSSPALTLTFDETGRALCCGVCTDFVRLAVDGKVHLPVTLTDSEGYLCFTFADGSLFYLLPEIHETCIVFDTAGFFPAESLTDRVGDDLSRLQLRFGLFEAPSDVVGAEVYAAAVGTVATAAVEDGFMGAKLALGVGCEPMGLVMALA